MVEHILTLLQFILLSICEVTLEHVKCYRVGWKNSRDLLDWPVCRGTNALLEKLHRVLELIEFGARFLELTLFLLLLGKLTRAFKHIVVDDEIHGLFICYEKHINHSIAIYVCKIKNLVILDV